MAEERRAPSRISRPPRKTPAERSAEFDETQARLKAEAAERRKAAAEASTKGKKKS